MAARCLDPAVPKRIEVDLALLAHDDRRRSAVARTIVQTAKQPKAQGLSRRPASPGIGTILRGVLLYEMHESTRCPRGQDCVSSCRLVTCAKASAGKRSGTSGTKLGNASLQWAFSDAAVLLLRNKAQGQKLLARVEKQPAQGKALTSLAHKLARAVYDLLTRDTVLVMDTCLNGDGSSAGEPAAALDTQGISLTSRPGQSAPARRHGTRNRTSALCSEPSRLIGHPLWLLDIRCWSAQVDVGCPSPAPAPHWRTPPVQPRFCRGR